MVIYIRKKETYIFLKRRGQRIVTDIPDNIRRLYKDEVKDMLKGISETASTEELRTMIVEIIVSETGISTQSILKVKYEH